MVANILNSINGLLNTSTKQTSDSSASQPLTAATPAANIQNLGEKTVTVPESTAAVPNALPREIVSSISRPSSEAVNTIVSGPNSQKEAVLNTEILNKVTADLKSNLLNPERDSEKLAKIVVDTLSGKPLDPAVKDVKFKDTPVFKALDYSPETKFLEKLLRSYANFAMNEKTYKTIPEDQLNTSIKNNLQPISDLTMNANKPDVTAVVVSPYFGAFDSQKPDLANRIKEEKNNLIIDLTEKNPKMLLESGEASDRFRRTGLVTILEEMKPSEQDRLLAALVKEPKSFVESLDQSTKQGGLLDRVFGNGVSDLQHGTHQVLEKVLRAVNTLVPDPTLDTAKRDSVIKSLESVIKHPALATTQKS